MRTQVAIIGGGPAGLLLGQILTRAGIDNVVLEARSREYVLGRIRAGVLEWGTVEVLRDAGVGARMDAEGFVHDGTIISSENNVIRVDLEANTGKSVMVYGQTEITQDLYDVRDGAIFHGVEDVTIDEQIVRFRHDSQSHELACDFVAGCDGFHGVSRASIPKTVLKEFERIYPFGWLGVLSETPPVNEELIYASHSRGFALASMRHANLSRYYIQVPSADRVEDWSDEAFWEEFKRRIPAEASERLVTGPSIEKSIAPLRSYVAEPMRWKNLFLCGDAAHIVPPTGAKGLNLAVSDVYYLARGLKRFYGEGDNTLLDSYSQDALARVWQAVRFSWSMTNMLHNFTDETAFEGRMRDAELAALFSSKTAQKVFAENYVGLPF